MSQVQITNIAEASRKIITTELNRIFAKSPIEILCNFTEPPFEKFRNFTSVTKMRI